MIHSTWDNEKDSSDNVLQLLSGHKCFLERNTGETIDASKQHYVFNEQMVLSNNRHFIAASMQEAQPNGDAPSESGSLQILGHCYVYMATRDEWHLNMAKKIFQAFVDYFYQEPVPDTPRMYISNWLVNGKEPVLANYPIDWESPTHSGFKRVILPYTNGLTKVPHGSPYFGEYLDKATFAYVGELTWDAINASVQAVKADGSIDWSNDGQQYDIDWIINWEGKKIDWDGNVLSTGHSEDEKGTMQLKDTSITGDYKTNFAGKVPVEFGGYLMPTNSAWHNRPLNVPVTKDNFGNAADAEQWFCDGAYLLWKLTGDDLYYRAWQCSLETCKSYSEIDLYDRFFRKSTNDKSPFTDGISYDYFYPGEQEASYSRDAEGYIVIDQSAAAQTTLEQQAVWFRISKDSKVRTQFGGVDNAGNPLRARIRLTLSQQKTDNDPSAREYQYELPQSTSTAVQTYDLPLSSLTPVTDLNGKEYFMADLRSVYTYGEPDVSTSMMTDYNILGSRQGSVNHTVFTSDSAGMGIGFWLLDAGTSVLNSITYKATRQVEIGIEDDNGWRWQWTLQPTETYVTQNLVSSQLVLRDYQPNHADTEERPSTPVYSVLEEFSITPVDSTETHFYWYCVNDVPPTFSLDDGYTIIYSVTISGDAAYTARLGDCTILDYKPNNLAFTPGVIPFSNISVPGNVRFDGWRGMPYPGYMHPFIYTHDRVPNEWTTHLNNMVEFLWASQQSYFDNFGELGPGMSAYIWNRWDNLQYGEPDTWTMYHWGDDHAWPGYQPRAYCNAARAWYELAIQNKPVPPKLQQYVENWATWLAQKFKEHGCTPTDWNTDGSSVFDTTDFTGHMSGLWLAGSCFAVLAGSTLSVLPEFIEDVVGELERNFIDTGIPGHIMNGSWSPAVRLDTGNGVENNGMFFGIWSGEIMRGLGTYLLYKQLNPKQDMYELITK